MFEELTKKYKVEYIAGGAVQNSLRVCQWVLNKPKSTTFFGAVGNDENAKILTNAAETDGVNVKYQIIEKEATGKCAVLITGHHRSLCAYLGAANHFTIDHLEKPENWYFIERALYYYVSGFFLTVSPRSALKVAEYSESQNRTFIMNLSAPFIPQFYTEQLMSLFPYVDILFGNETEAVAFSKCQNFGTENVEEIAVKARDLQKFSNKRPRMVVFTQGSDEIIVAQESGVQKFPIIKLSEEKIVDTNGAGDAFVGGFLAQLVMGKSLDICIKSGAWTASEVIQKSGCTFPKEKKTTALKNCKFSKS